MAIAAALTSLLAELGHKLEPGQQVALDAATLAALEQITTTVANFPATQAVSLAAFPTFPELEVKNDAGSPLAVAGPLTDAQLRATPVPVSGTVTATLGEIEVKNDAGNPIPVNGTVAVSNQPSQPLTDTQLRATSVPVSGPATDAQLRATALPVSGPLTDTQLRATAVPVSLASLPEVEIKNDSGNPVPISGTVTANLGTIDGAATESSLAAINGKLSDLSGTWGYAAGTNGTVVLSGSKRVIGIAAHAATAGSFTINGGDSIPVPANSSIEIQPIGNLVDPTIVFSAGIDSYFVESVV